MSTLPPQRRALILEHVRRTASARIVELVELLGISEATVRRDVEALVGEGHLQRVHGGVVMAPVVPAGRGLVATPSRINREPLKLGVLVPGIKYFEEVLAGAKEAAARLGAEVVPAMSYYLRPEQDLATIQRLLDDGVDGLALTPVPDTDGTALLGEQLRSLSVPMVLMERCLESTALVDRIDHVVSDHRTGARIAVEHLFQLGHRRIALAVRTGGPTVSAVREGYAEAVHALGLHEDDDELSEPQFITSAPEPDAASIRRILSFVLDHRASAVLVHSDREALALVELARQEKIRVPGDLAVISYDDDLAEFAGVPMTAVAPPKGGMGRAAIELLTARIAEGPARPVHHLTLQPALVVRQSCGAKLGPQGT